MIILQRQDAGLNIRVDCDGTSITATINESPLFNIQGDQFTTGDLLEIIPDDKVWDNFVQSDGGLAVITIARTVMAKDETVSRLARQFRMDTTSSGEGYSTYLTRRKQGKFWWNILTYFNRIVEVEKLGDLLTNELDTRWKFRLSAEAKKRHQILQLPASFVRTVETLCDEPLSLINSVQKAVQNDEMIDGNDLVKFGEWLTLYADLNANLWARYRVLRTRLTLYALCVCEIHSVTHMPFNRICAYIAKQAPYMRNTVDSSEILSLPLNTAREYRDYIVKMGATDYTPAELVLEKAHLAARQKVEIAPEDEVVFAERSQELSFLNATVTIGTAQYRFAVPQSYKELVEIGATFHNCLPSCGPAFMGGAMNIVFVTVGNEACPKYALEIGNNGNLIQAVCDHDLAIADEDALSAIKQYVKRLVGCCA